MRALDLDKACRPYTFPLLLLYRIHELEAQYLVQYTFNQSWIYVLFQTTVLEIAAKMLGSVFWCNANASENDRNLRDLQKL